jgi:DNA-binding response OmpR family regulator
MSKRVLVVDSSRVIRTLLQIHLQQAGHGVLICPGSQEALQLLHAMPEAPDLVFLAVHPALKEDYEVVRSVSKSAQTCLIVMALQEDQAHIQRHLRETSLTYLLKPFHIQEALALVTVPLPGDRQAHSLTFGTHPAERGGSR